MIRLRQSIERGVRHRWLGPLFVVLLCVMLALLVLHTVHDAEHSATSAGEFCLALVVMFSVVIVIRLRWRVLVRLVFPRSGRAPPVRRVLTLPVRPASFSSPPPLRL